MNQPLLDSRNGPVTITSEGYVSTNQFLQEHLKQVDFAHQSFYIYKFKVKRGNKSWIVYKRVQDFMDLENNIKHDPFLFLRHRDVEKEKRIDDPGAVQKHILDYINSADQNNIEFKKFFLLTDIQYGDAQKQYECVMKKKAGGRHAESKCRRCGTFWGRFDKRYFSISSECITYSTGPFENDARPREILLIDQNFQFEYGQNATGERRGIKLRFTTRDLYLKAPDDWTFILFVVGLKSAQQESPYNQIQRFNSFAQPRKGRCKWYVDGENYFADLMDDLLQAKDLVCITDWWLSPDFFLKRPISTDPDDQTNRNSRFDLVLKNIADRGVQVRIIIYDAPAFALNNDAQHTERCLQMVSNNIKVLKHPSNLIPIKWSHHEKMVLIDNTVAYMGGLDICFGRMDNQKHLLHDNDEKEFWPGIDYSNSRIKDFVNVQQTAESLIDRNSTPRMPWHDIAIRIRGDTALDMYRHFMQYWNYVLLENKYEDRQHIGYLGPNRSTQVEPIQMKKQNQRLSEYIKQVEQEAKEDEQPEVTNSKMLDGYSSIKQGQKRLSMIGKNYQMPNKGYIDIMKNQIQALQKQEQQEDQQNYPKLIHQDTNDPDELKMVIKKQEAIGSCQTQLLRSASQWSIGNSTQNTEQSILAAYIQLITEAQYFIYIENQFFISNSAGKDVINAIAETIIVRIKQAVLKNEPFKVIVFVPLLPGFEGEIDGNAPVLKVQLHWEYATICRGEKSIYSQIQKYLQTVKSDKQIEDYIQFYSLRTHAKIRGKPVTEQIYIHSKLMIVDDEYVIMGSANINDRSMLGDRDSELAVFVEDENTVLSRMNGMLIQRSQFALTLRKSLYMEHFGLTDAEVQDPLDPKLLQTMYEIAEQNTYSYRYIFACYPDNNVTDIDKLKDFKKSARIDLYDELSQTIKGNAVLFPLDFMKDENLQIKILDREIVVPYINFT